MLLDTSSCLDPCLLCSAFCRLSCLGSSGAAPEGTQLTLLPLSAWSAVQFSSEGQLQRSEAGLLLGQQHQQAPPAAAADASTAASKHRVVSCRVYDVGTGELQASSIGQEGKLSA